MEGTFSRADLVGDISVSSLKRVSHTVLLQSFLKSQSQPGHFHLAGHIRVGSLEKANNKVLAILQHFLQRFQHHLAQLVQRQNRLSKKRGESAKKKKAGTGLARLAPPAPL